MTPQPTSGLVATLIDVDNLALGGSRAMPEVSAVLDRLATLTRGTPVTAAANRKVASSHLTCWARHGWRTLVADPLPNAADVLLLEAGHDWIGRGRRTLVIGSGDHIFASLASEADLHVLSFRRQLSRRLELAATSVTLLDDLIPAYRTAA